VRWDEIGQLDCSVAQTLSVVGDRWTLLVLRDLFLGSHRFDDFRRSLGISPALLAERLDTLHEHGLIERRVYQDRPTRHAYWLTPKGLDLYPVLVGLLRWGDRHAPSPDGAPVALEHRTCGGHGLPVLCCACCGEPVEAREMRAHPRAGLLDRARRGKAPTRSPNP
jgi:DNA-binding HxlR family transcriptional regulator